MGPSGIVKLDEYRPSPVLAFRDRFVGSQVHLLVLDALPQPFDEHIILPASLPVHADLDPIGFQQAGEGVTCELASLICVEYLRRAVASQGFFERLATQKSVSIVTDTRQASTLRLCQSIAARYTNPLAIGMT